MWYFVGFMAIFVLFLVAIVFRDDTKNQSETDRYSSYSDYSDSHQGNQDSAPGLMEETTFDGDAVGTSLGGGFSIDTKGRVGIDIDENIKITSDGIRWKWKL